MARAYALFPIPLKLAAKRWLTAIAGGLQVNRSRPAESEQAWRSPAVSPDVVAIAQSGYVPAERFGDGQGVNLIGYVRGEFGIAENVRSYAGALMSSGYPLSLVNLDLPVPGRTQDASMEHLVSRTPDYPVNVSFFNADQTFDARNILGARIFEDRYNIAFWLWELERFPDAWKKAVAYFDEFWAPSDFVCNSIRSVTDKPVIKIPKAVEFSPPQGISRDHFGISPDVFAFLFSYDFNSFVERKNPLAVVKAFKKAFEDGRRDVQLVIKSSNGDRFPSELSQLAIAVADDSRIVIRDGVFGRGEMFALLSCVDSYVSLHRSEGFGLGMAEAMYLGKPVVATGYSGNTDFMSSQNSCLVEFDWIQVPANAYPHWHGQRWADPRVDDAAKHMRELVDNPDYRSRIGRAAAKTIREKYSREKAAGAFIGRVQRILGAEQGVRNKGIET